jgi:hypothetical protein
MLSPALALAVPCTGLVERMHWRTERRRIQQHLAPELENLTSVVVTEFLVAATYHVAAQSKTPLPCTALSPFRRAHCPPSMKTSRRVLYSNTLIYTEPTILWRAQKDQLVHASLQLKSVSVFEPFTLMPTWSRQRSRRLLAILPIKYAMQSGRNQL